MAAIQSGRVAETSGLFLRFCVKLGGVDGGGWGQPVRELCTAPLAQPVPPEVGLGPAIRFQGLDLLTLSLTTRA